MGLKIDFCALGLHQWHHPVSNITEFREDGVETIFYSTAIQIGQQTCSRSHCDAFRHVARRLKSGSDTATGAWFPISQGRQGEIAKAPKFPTHAVPVETFLFRV